MADPFLGRHLGRYELRALLGAGGMARVYSAFDPILQRDVALKVLHSFAQQQADFAERFRHEAQILASLRHPNIVQVYDYGEQDYLSFIVQQLHSGPTLEQELAALAAQGCLMERTSVEQVLMQLADALDYAHSRKLIHRDLKPSNIIRNERGDVVVTDFGIAKALTTALTKTQTGWVLGTPAYISPEQARGSPSLSAASDIYTLGVILFELLTGQVPFNDSRPMEVLLGHIQQLPPSPRSLRPSLPPIVEHVVLKALAKDPALRYASAGALVGALITSWPAIPVQSIHSQPTVVSLTPFMAGKSSAVADAVVPQPVDNPPPMANPPTIIASSPRTPPVSPLRPAWQRYVRTGLARMSLPALLMIVVALFFLELPAQKRFGTIPTPTRKATEAAGALGFTTTAPEPTFTTTPQPTFTTTPQPTFTTIPQPTFTTTPQPTLSLPIPATVLPSPPPPPPQPTFNPADFW
jgi:eukaryotic-like serine/threonine-protein kinase